MCCERIPLDGWKGFLVARKRIEAKFNSRRILQQLADQYSGLSTRSNSCLIKKLKKEKGRQQASLLLESGVTEFLSFLQKIRKQQAASQNVTLSVDDTQKPCPIARRLLFLGSNSIVLKHRHCNKHNYFSQYSAVDPEYVNTLCLLIGEDGTCVLVRLIIEDATTENHVDFFVWLSFLCVDLNKFHSYLESKCESKVSLSIHFSLRFFCEAKKINSFCFRFLFYYL
jgi:hypothetical protein